MKITILTLGSRGDVEPFLALAVGLQKAGHQAKLACSPRYSDWVRAYGVGAYPVSFDLVAALREAEQARKQGRRPLPGEPEPKEKLLADLVGLCEDYLAAAQDADFVLQTGIAPGGVEIADALDLPMATAFLHPMLPTAEFPSFYLPLRRSLGAGYNRFTHRLALKIIGHNIGPAVSRWRAQRFALPPWDSYAAMLAARQPSGAPVLHGYSPSILPSPADWDASCHVTGAWQLDPPPGWQPPQALLNFLAAGPAPVYIGFGSMRGEDPQRMTREAVQALREAGQRGVLLSGGGGGLSADDCGRDVFFIDDVPHAWLFPRMAAVVHHGGAGTTANTLRAGVPGIILPRVVDQFAWGDCIARLGIGLRGPRMSKLSAKVLAPALRRVASDTVMRDKAAQFGRCIAAEQGVARAVALIEAHAAQYRRRGHRTVATMPA